MNDDEEEYSYSPPDTRQDDDVVTGYDSNATLTGAGEDQPPEPEYDFSKFKPVPDQPGPEQRQLPEPPPDNAYEFDKFKPMPDPEGPLATAWRVIKSDAPGVVTGAIAGSTTMGAASNAPIHPYARVGLGLLGAAYGGYKGSELADKYREDDSLQRAINEQENPWSARIARGVSNLLAFRPGSVEGPVRAASGAISGLTEAGMQAYHGKRPGETTAEFLARAGADVGTATVAGLAAPKPWGYVSGAERAATRIGADVRTALPGGVPPPPAAPGTPFPRGGFPKAPDVEVPPLPAWSGVKTPPEAPFPRGGFPRAPDIEVPPLPVTTGIKAPAPGTPPSRPAMPDGAGTSKELPPPPKPPEPTAPGERPPGGVNQIPPGGVDPTVATGIRRGAALPAAEPPPGTARAAVPPAAEPPPATAVPRPAAATPRQIRMEEGMAARGFTPEQIRNMSFKEMADHLRNPSPGGRGPALPAAEPPPAVRAPAVPAAEPIPGGPLRREVAPQHMPAYDAGWRGGRLPKGFNDAEQAAWDRGANDRMNYDRGREPLRRGEVVRGRSGRPIQTGRLPIGTERAILEAGHARATGPRQAPRAPYREAAERGGPQDADFTQRYEDAKGRTIEDEVAAFRRGEGVKPEDNPESPHYIPDPEAMGMGHKPGDAHKRRILPKTPGDVEASVTRPGDKEPIPGLPDFRPGAVPRPAAPGPAVAPGAPPNKLVPPRPAAPASGPAAAPAPAPGLVNRLTPPRPAAPAPGPAAPAPGLVNRLARPGAAGAAVGAGGGPPPVRPPAPPAGGPPPPPVHPPVGAPPAPPARPAVPLQQATPHDLKNGPWVAVKRWLGVNASATPSGRAARNRYLEAQGEGEHARQVAESRFTNDMHRLLNKTDPNEQRMLVNWIQGGNHFPGYTPRPEFMPVVTALRQIYRDFENYITSLPKHAQMQFWANDKYLTGQYKDPAGAQRFFSYATGSGSGGAGGRGSTMKRKFATDEDARAAGFEPISTNPIERVLRYTHAMSEYIAKQKELDAGQRAGYIAYFGPKVVAGAGTPDPYVRGRPPEGWTKLYGVEDAGGRAAYAPREYAETFNNAHGPGLGIPQPIMDVIRKSVNTYTALELAGPAYHFLNTMHESLGSYWATALSQAVSGKFAGAAKSAVQGVLSPLAGIPRIGKHIPGVTDTNRILDVYLGRAQNVMPQERAIVDAMKAANWKPIGVQHTMDYAMLGTGSMWTSHLRGSLVPELKAELAKVTSIRSLKDVGTALTVLPNMVGRVAQTFAHPLFQYYIPRMKAAAGYDNIRAWLDANPHATPDQLREASIKILKSIDNRMGEMAHDNMLMSRSARDIMALSLRSPSFSIGGVVREILAGGRSLGEGILKRENRISLTSPNYDPRAAYAIAFFAATGAITATYQYLKTGKMPDQDELGHIMLGTAKTGGKVPGVGGRKQVDEMAIMPGYNKDFRGYYHSFTGELYNKMPGLYTAIHDQLRGKTFSHLGDSPMVPPRATVGEELKARAGAIGERLKPIMLRQAEQTPYKGSNISYPEQVMGIRSPGTWETDPETSKAGAEKRAISGWEYFEKRRNQDRAQRGLPPLPVRPLPPAPKAAPKAAP